MNPFFLNLAPANASAPAVARLYLVMAVVFFSLGAFSAYRLYTDGEQALMEYVLPLFQMAIAIVYLVISYQRKASAGTQYVQVTDDLLELKLKANQAPLTLHWNAISLLRVQNDRIIYRLNDGKTGEVVFDSIPEEHESAVRNAIREAGRKKGVSL